MRNRTNLRRLIGAALLTAAIALGTAMATTASAQAMPRNPCSDYANQVRTSAYRDLAEAATGDEAVNLPQPRAGEPVEPMDTGEGSGERDRTTC